MKYELRDADTGEKLRTYHPFEIILRKQLGPYADLFDFLSELALAAFVPARALLGAEDSPFYAQRRSFLRRHPEIRRRQKGGRRLEIHAGDWLRAIGEEGPEGLSLNNLPAPLVDELLNQLQEADRLRRRRNSE